MAETSDLNEKVALLVGVTNLKAVNAAIEAAARVVVQSVRASPVQSRPIPASPPLASA